MIIDEETDFLRQVKAMLEKEHVDVVTVRNSREALDRLNEENEEAFDLILVHTRMPGSTITTALFSMKPTSKKQHVGIENFLQIPFTREELVEFVKEKMQPE